MPDAAPPGREPFRNRQQDSRAVAKQELVGDGLLTSLLVRVGILDGLPDEFLPATLPVVAWPGEFRWRGGEG